MLRIDRKNEEIIVIFSPINVIKKALTFSFCFYIILNVVLYFIQEYPEPLTTLKYSLGGMTPILIISIFYKRTEIYFRRSNIEIYKNFYGIKKLKLVLKYSEVKSMENISLGGR